jgi:phospholipid-transporting ATPase
MGARISAFFSKQPDEPEFRIIDVARGGYGLSKEQAAIPDNSINTAKYNLVTFLPRSLFEQFRRAANIYFLVISVLMLVGTYTSLFDSPLAPFSTLMPLIMVLVITMAKEGMEDLKRHRSDHMVNNKRMASVLSTAAPGHFEQIPWRAVRVGSIVQVLGGEEIPADLVLLTSSEPNGVAYVETSNIDGETNLKIRSSAPTRPSLPAGPVWSSAEELHSLAMALEYERPNPRIHFFTGTLKLEEQSETAETVTRTVPVDQANVLLRGSSLKNTRWALGLVVYTGKETKIVKNARSAPSKRYVLCIYHCLLEIH